MSLDNAVAVELILCDEMRFMELSLSVYRGAFLTEWMWWWIQWRNVMHARSAIISVRVDVIVVGFPYTGAHPLIIIFPLCLQNIDQACAALFL